jgi:DNA polymerase/3'-5' exonuclease PolX
MKDGKKWPWEIAMPEAEAIIERLKPCCERIAIAGSLRRLKRFVSDIEIAFVPKMTKRPDGLFDEKIISVANEVIERLLEDGYFQKRPNKNGAFTWGEANKLAIRAESGIPVDLFACPPENWWVTLVVRTGSKETNLRLTTGANRLNRSLNAYGYGVTNRATGEVTPATSEQEVFALCGIEYLKPKDR